MTTVDEIEAAVWALSPADRAEVIRRVDTTMIGENHGWVDERGNDAWDRQMIADAKAGRLHRLMTVGADADIAAGRERPRPGDQGELPSALFGTRPN